MVTNSTSGTAEVTRVGKFGLVGIFNTAIDFVIYNILFGTVGLDVRLSNIISTTTAMIFSFFANKEMVFKRKEGSLIRQAVTFYIVTAFGLYVLQTGTIHILTDVWTDPMKLAVSTVHAVGLGPVFSDTFIINNGAKACGTIFSLTWNYLAYKMIVFR